MVVGISRNLVGKGDRIKDWALAVGYRKISLEVVLKGAASGVKSFEKYEEARREEEVLARGGEVRLGVDCY